MSQSVSPPSQYLTLPEYLASTDGADARYELVNGIVVDMPPESDENNDIAKRLLFELAKHFPITLLAHKDTEVEVTGRRATCRIPDLLVHTEESKAALAGIGRATITRDMPPPAIAIEIVSPGQANRDRDYRYKYVEYAARGITEYWIVDPQMQQVTLCRWDNGLYENSTYTGTEPIRSSLVSDFDLSSNDIFGSTTTPGQ